MNANNSKRLFAAVALREQPNENSNENGAKPSSNVQLLRQGSFQHAWHGKLHIDADLFASLIQNFNEGARGIDIALDVEHMPDQGAAGWFRRLFTEADGAELWGEVEWTPAGRQLVESETFKYISIEYDLAYADEEGEEHGPTMLGAALTNRPFIKRMRAASFCMNEEYALLTEPEHRLHRELRRVETERARLEEALRRASVEKALSEAKRAGRVSPAMEGWLTEIAEREGLERMEQVLSTLPRRIDFSEIGSSNTGASGLKGAADALDSAVSAEMKRMRSENPDKEPAYGEALSAVQASRPGLVEAYKKELRRRH